MRWGGMGLDGMGWDGVSKVFFNFLYTSWVYRPCIYLLIYVIKFCHQHSYGFQNLISSWRVWIWFLKLLWGNVFFKNHAKSRVSKNSDGSGHFLNFFSNFLIFLEISFKGISFGKLTPLHFFEQKFELFRNFV